MWKFLADGLKIGGQIAIGYFANDVASAAGKVTGVKTDTSGKYPWWFLLLVFGVVGAGFYFLVDMILPKKAKR